MQVQTLNTYLSTASAAGAGFAQEIHPWETWMGQHCERPRRQCLQHCGQGRLGSHRHAGGPRISLSDHTKHDGESPPEFRIISDRFGSFSVQISPHESIGSDAGVYTFPLLHFAIAAICDEVANSSFHRMRIYICGWRQDLDFGTAHRARF